MKKLLNLFALLAVAVWAYAGPVGPPAGAPILNSSIPQTATFNVSSGTVRGQFSPTSIKWPDGTIQVSSPTTGGGGGTPGGANTNIQFNNSGAFGGSSNLTWDNTNKQLYLKGSGSGSQFIVDSTSPGPETYSPFEVRDVGSCEFKFKYTNTNTAKNSFINCSTGSDVSMLDLIRDVPAVNFNVPVTITTTTIKDELKDQLGSTLLLHNGNSTYLGSSAGNTTILGAATDNTVIGAGSMFNSTSGSNNTALGFISLNGNGPLTRNTAVGVTVLNGNGITDNTGVGYSALNTVQQNRNTAVGASAGFSLSAASSNTLVGYGAGFGNDLSSAATTGNGNVFLGYEAGVSTSATINNSIAIGYGATVVSSNTAQIGGAANSSTAVDLIVSTISPNAMDGAGLSDCHSASNAVTWTSSTKQFGCNTISGSGGGSSSLAVTTGTTSGFSSLASSPTAVVNFDNTYFTAALKGGATAFVSIAGPNGANQLVALNGSTQLPAVSGVNLTNLTASSISAGSLGPSVIASSIAVNAVTPTGVAAGTYSNITLPGANVSGNISGNAANITGNLAAAQVAAGTLGPSVIASSIAVNAVTPTAVSAGAYPNITGVGTLTSGTWSATRLVAGEIPADVAYLDVNQIWTSPQTHTSSVTVNAAFGAGAAGSAVTISSNTIMPGTTFYQNGEVVHGAGVTLSALSASLPVKTDANKKLTAAAIDLSGTEATGTLASGRFPALTGDITTSAGSLATTAAASQTHITSIAPSGTLNLGSTGNAVAISSNTILAGTTFYANASAVFGSAPILSSLTSGRCVQTTTGGLLTVAGGACGTSGGYATIQDEGSNLTQEPTVNFIGSSITCVDNAGQTRTDCTVTGGGGSPGGGNYNVQIASAGAFAGVSGFNVNPSSVVISNTYTTYTSTQVVDSSFTLTNVSTMTFPAGTAADFSNGGVISLGGSVGQSGEFIRSSGPGASPTWGSDWEVLVSTNLVAASSSTASFSIGARDVLRFVIRVTGYGGGGDIASLVFNDDVTAGNYHARHINFSNASTPVLTGTSFTTGGDCQLGPTAITNGRTVEVTCSNNSATRKICTIREQEEATSQATLAQMEIGYCEWFNTAAQITKVKLRTNAGNNMNAGTGFVVEGKNMDGT